MNHKFNKPKFTKFKKTSNPKDKEINDCAKYLIIVESPSKCTTIENYLGKEYACIASNGHFKRIEGLKSINAKNNFNITYSIDSSKQYHVSKMREIINKFNKSNVIIATDDDREGEAIGWHICIEFDLPVETTKRIIFHEITKQAIQNAILNPQHINMDIVYSQQTRQILDMLIGYKISPLLWKYLYNNKENSLSAGRCQTPALRLVYENDKKIKSEKDSFQYKITGFMTERNIEFDLCEKLENESKVNDFLNESKTHNHILSILEPKDSYRNPPKPYNTSALLQSANNVLNLSPKDTMSYAQQLYQSGMITYMRTDSIKFSKVFVNSASDYIKDTYGSEYISQNLNSITNISDSNPHEAIRVTQLKIDTAGSPNKKINALYSLIRKNTLETCMSTAHYKNIEIQISAPKSMYYKKAIEIPIFLGWKILNTKITNNENDELLYFKMRMASNPKIEYSKIISSVVDNKKHYHYTESSLVKHLEDIGIGRPSTFALIVDTIVDRGYVKCMNIDGETRSVNEHILTQKKFETIKKEKIFGEEKRKLVIQPIGILTIEFLIKHLDSMFSYDYTKIMEIELDKIADGSTKKWYEICKDVLDEIKTRIKPLSKIEKQSYPIDETHTLIYEKYGIVISSVDSNNNTVYKSVRKDINIDLEKLKNKEYKLEDILEFKEDDLGKYEDEQIELKSGKYGPYVKWGTNIKSIKDINMPLNEITRNDILDFLQKDKTEEVKNEKILRVLSENISIRKGKYGYYVYYKQKSMKSPSFFNLKKFPDSILDCDANILLDWIKNKYKIE
jgi:DNA topoisomerase-1